MQKKYRSDNYFPIRLETPKRKAYMMMDLACRFDG